MDKAGPARHMWTTLEALPTCTTAAPPCPQEPCLQPDAFRLPNSLFKNPKENSLEEPELDELLLQTLLNSFGKELARMMQAQLALNSASALAEAAQLQDELPVLLSYLLTGTFVRASAL